MSLLRSRVREPAPGSGTVSIPNETVYETFDAGSLTNYTGDLERFDVRSTNPFNSTNSLHYIGPDSAFPWTFNVTLSGSDATFGRILHSNNGPAADSRFRFWWKAGDRFYDVAGLIFAATDIDNCYEMRVNCVDGILEIVKRSSGNPEETVAGSSFDRTKVTEGEWHMVGGEFHLGGTSSSNGEIKSILYDSEGSKIEAATGNDQTYTSGQFGWVVLREESNKSIQLDYLKEVQ